MKVRVSLGSAIKLKKIQGRLAAEPTTIYLMTYYKNKCTANCAFCTQARSSSANIEKLSRVAWPEFELEKLFEGYSDMDFKSLKRICVQAVNYENVFLDVLKIVRYLKKISKLPISLSIKPLEESEMKTLSDEGVEKICFPIDAATPRLFNMFKGLEVNGPYSFEKQLSCLENAVKIFGEYNVTTHLIIGLGESEREAVDFMIRMREIGVNVGLFALTPLKGTKLEDSKPPLIEAYRRLQLARHIIFNENADISYFIFNGDKQIKKILIPAKKFNRIIQSGEPFLTSGCHGCNRPFYNEKVSGPIYNYPSIELVKKDIQKIRRELRGLLNDLESDTSYSK